MIFDSTRRQRLKVTGQVQGVGFRPYVYRLARSLGLVGSVVNDGSGATIEVQGLPEVLAEFARRLPAQQPPLSDIRSIVTHELTPVSDQNDFVIAASGGGELADAQVTVDTATCPDCLRELADPADRRYRYPFINCTNCGPRYSIIRAIPYDRPNTTMADFAMCRFCGRQYSDPEDRRFHAQPIACPQCGPSVWLVDVHGRQIFCDDPIGEAARLLRRGRIIALKGLGGFHLACRADNDHAVRRLRQRKHRDAKPFALMARDMDQLRKIVLTTPEDEKLLAGPQRPIVLLPRREDADVAEAVAPGLKALGVMLPYTPLHHLLLGHDLPPLVMTSGNVSDEPLTRDNEDAIAHLGVIADALLLHNRRIQRSLDDSVVLGGAPALSGQPTRPLVLRRGRGYAPMPVMMGEGDTPAVLAVGAELKSSVCLYRAGRAVLSEHIGDLKDGRVYRHFMGVINDLEKLLDFEPQVLAADAHPQYLSSDYARRRSSGQLAGRPALPLVTVQHHHAHIVSCMAENGCTDDVIGIAADGVGYGDDGAVWGCEIMRCSLSEYRRLGHLRYFRLPGSDAAALETYRPAVGVLAEALGPLLVSPRVISLLGQNSTTIKRVFEQLVSGVNCPLSSSLGRLFDAVSALCGLARANQFEGQAPMLLEAAAAGGVEDVYPFDITGQGPFEIDYRMMIEAMLSDLERHPVEVISAKFHNTVAAFLAEGARRAERTTGLRKVALSGGCMVNRYLTGRLERLLRQDGFTVLTHRQIPCNDGGVALGQAVIAARRLAPRRGLMSRSEEQGK